MEAAIVSAIIGGIFSIIGIFIKHRLSSNSSSVNTVYSVSPSKPKSSSWNDIKKGFLLLAFCFIFINIYISVTNPTGDLADKSVILFFFILFPAYAGYRILRGIFRFFTG